MRLTKGFLSTFLDVTQIILESDVRIIEIKILEFLTEVELYERVDFFPYCGRKGGSYTDEFILLYYIHRVMDGASQVI